MKNHFAVCITDAEPDLERRKIYQVLPDESASNNNYLRVIDESGEDYLYPISYFVLLELPETTELVLLKSAVKIDKSVSCRENKSEQTAPLLTLGSFSVEFVF